jgi:hypothetical protein
VFRRKNGRPLKRTIAVAVGMAATTLLFMLSACRVSRGLIYEDEISVWDHAVENNGGTHVKIRNELYFVEEDGIYAALPGGSDRRLMVSGDMLGRIFVEDDTIYYAERFANRSVSLYGANLDGAGKTVLADGDILQFYVMKTDVFYSELRLSEDGVSKYLIRAAGLDGDNRRTIFEEALHAENPEKTEWRFQQYGSYVFIFAPDGSLQRMSLAGDERKTLRGPATSATDAGNPFLVYADRIYVPQSGDDGSALLAEGDMDGETWIYHSLIGAESIGEWTIRRSAFFYDERGEDKGLHRITLSESPDGIRNKNVITGDIVRFAIVGSDIYVDVKDAYDANSVLSEVYRISASGTVKYERSLLPERTARRATEIHGSDTLRLGCAYDKVLLRFTPNEIAPRISKIFSETK